MKVYALIEEGVVVEFSNSEPASSDLWVEVLPGAELGGSYSDGVFYPAKKTQSQQIRSKRNQLLTASDWTQVADAPVDQAAWATYRQDLRDITEQTGFPTDVVWPTPPTLPHS